MRQQLKLWDSKRERKLTGQTHCQPFAEQRDRASPGNSYPAADLPIPAAGRRQQGGEGGKLGLREGTPYHTANRPPVSNQRFPEILDGRHPLGGSQLNTRRPHPNGAGRNRLGPRRGEGAPHPGRVCPSSSWWPEMLRPGKAQNAGPTESAYLWNTRKLEPHARQGPLHIEQMGA